MSKKQKKQSSPRGTSPTISQIAEKAGVSIATVSRVFNRKDRVRPEVAEHIKKIAMELGYSPRQATRKDTLIIVVEDMHSETFSGYVGGLLWEMIRLCAGQGVRLEIILPHELPLVRGRYIIGLIALLWTDESVKQLQQLRHTNCVTVNFEVEGIPSVCSDESQGMALAVDMLADQGHREIVLLLEHHQNWCNEQRVLGFKQALAARGMDPSDERVSRFASGNLLHALALAVKSGTTGLVVAGEDLGVKVMHNLDLLGKTIPTDISVVSFENYGVSDHLLPPQSTISQNFKSMCMTIMDLIEAPATPKDRRERIGYIRIDRSSIAKPA